MAIDNGKPDLDASKKQTLMNGLQAQYEKASKGMDALALSHQIEMRQMQTKHQVEMRQAEDSVNDVGLKIQKLQLEIMQDELN